jgi:DNA-binding response OmpR family regulator
MLALCWPTTLVVDGRSVVLRRGEATVLEVLASLPTRWWSVFELAEESFTTPKCAVQQVHNIRAKSGHGVITTRRGFGYRIGGPCIVLVGEAEHRAEAAA